MTITVTVPVIRLTAHEIQSGYDRQAWAEALILQLPDDHDGRNSWLINYGETDESAQKRSEWNVQAIKDGRKPSCAFNHETRSTGSAAPAPEGGAVWFGVSGAVDETEALAVALFDARCPGIRMTDEDLHYYRSAAQRAMQAVADDLDTPALATREEAPDWTARTEAAWAENNREVAPAEAGVGAVTHSEACHYADTSGDPLISMARAAWQRLEGEHPDVHAASVTLHGLMLALAYEALRAQPPAREDDREAIERAAYRRGWNDREDDIIERAERIAPPAREDAQPVAIVPPHCTGVSLAFEPGVLHVSKDGSGYIAIDEKHFELEDDRCVGPDGPEGSLHWITRLDASEVAALRDFLTGATTQPAPEAEKLPLSAGTHWWHPDNDENGFTCWGDAFEDATDGGWDGPVRLERARRLPDVWAVRIDMDTDGDGEVDDYEVRLFATEAEALAALQQEGR